MLLAGGLDMKATLAVRGLDAALGTSVMDSLAAGTEAALPCSGFPPLVNLRSPSQPMFISGSLVPQGKQHYLLYCLTPAMKPRMLMTGAPARPCFPASC